MPAFRRQLSPPPTAPEPPSSHFDWTLRPYSRAAHELTDEAKCAADAVRKSKEGTRKRQERHQVTYDAAMSAIIANASLNALGSPPKRTIVTRSKVHLERGDRYRHAGMTGAFPQRLDELEKAGWLIQHVAPASQEADRYASTISAGPVLVKRLKALGVDAMAFRQQQDGEVLRLKSEKRGQKRYLIDYADTEQTVALRGDVERINAALADADLGLALSYAGTVDLSKRRLVRAFIDNRFDHGGRYAGGFWMQMPKKARFEALRIDEERIVELDFHQLHPNIAYAIAGEVVPQGDLYEITGLEEVPRRARKKLVNAMLWDEGERASLMKGSREHFPARINGRKAAALVEAQHPAIASLLGNGVGARIMGIESQIITRVMIDLIDEGITALPIHDAILVPASKAFLAQRVMEDAYRSITGQRIRVSRNCG